MTLPAQPTGAPGPATGTWRTPWFYRVVFSALGLGMLVVPFLASEEFDTRLTLGYLGMGAAILIAPWRPVVRLGPDEVFARGMLFRRTIPLEEVVEVSPGYGGLGFRTVRGGFFEATWVGERWNIASLLRVRTRADGVADIIEQAAVQARLRARAQGRRLPWDDRGDPAVQRECLAGWVVVDPEPAPAGLGLTGRDLAPFDDWFTVRADARERLAEDTAAQHLLTVALTPQEAAALRERVPDGPWSDLLRHGMAITDELEVLGHQVVRVEQPFRLLPWYLAAPAAIPEYRTELGALNLFKKPQAAERARDAVAALTPDAVWTVLTLLLPRAQPWREDDFPYADQADRLDIVLSRRPPDQG